MDFSQAPLMVTHGPGPKDGEAWWLKTQDNVRIRVAAWGRSATQGTVLMFPGRTEYVEKYGPAAAEFRTRGYATISIDWRGQGLADRFLPDPLVGTVDDFDEYQRDVGTMLRAAFALALPKPWHLLGHSMGGCIGLRALMQDLPVASAGFTGPMWGIHISRHLRLMAWALSWLMPRVGRKGDYPPSSKSIPYVLSAPFEDNMLTRDRDMYEMMQLQLRDNPSLSLAGPSYAWLNAALRECRDMARLPSPKVPCLTYLGTNERIVDVARIHDRMDRWQGGHLELVPGGEHEVIMDVPETRKQVFDGLAAHFNANS